MIFNYVSAMNISIGRLDNYTRRLAILAAAQPGVKDAI